MKCLLNLFSYKYFFLKNYFNWLFINSYFTFINLITNNFLNTFFFNVYMFSLENKNIVTTLDMPLKTLNISFIKKKLFYYFFLTQTTTPVHWVYFNIGLEKLFKTDYSKMNYFFFYGLKNFINMLYNLLKHDYLFLFLTLDILKYEVSTFSKYMFGIDTYVEFPFIFDNSKLNLRSHVSKYYFVNFLVQKNIKLLIFLNYEYSLFYMDFFRQTNIITFGLISCNVNIKDLDYWLFIQQNDFIANYLLFSLVFSIYNKLLFEQQLRVFLLYNYSFLKVLKI